MKHYWQLKPVKYCGNIYSAFFICRHLKFVPPCLGQSLSAPFYFQTSRVLLCLTNCARDLSKIFNKAYLATNIYRLCSVLEVLLKTLLWITKNNNIIKKDAKEMTYLNIFLLHYEGLVFNLIVANLF